MKIAVRGRCAFLSVLLMLSGIAFYANASPKMPNKENKMKEKRTSVSIETTEGTIVISLYNETPGHRDNFLKNVREHAYDGVLFHRVIKDFMIQAGDPKSKNAKAGEMLGTSDHGSEIAAEFVYPMFFHKRGAIAAARTGDNVNPEKKSSGSQFYIVTGKKYSEQELIAMERTLQQRQKQALFDSLAMQHRQEIIDLRRARNSAGLQALQERLIKETEASLMGHLFKFTPEQRTVYTTIGGAPFLDGNYSVFGEVTVGIDVVEKIEQAETDKNDRPIKDVRILRTTVLE